MISLVTKVLLTASYTNNSDVNLKKNKKYVLSNSESVQCNFFIFDHVTFIQFENMLLCTKFHENRMIFH